VMLGWVIHLPSNPWDSGNSLDTGSLRGSRRQAAVDGVANR
jgi:hypothetical protein